jgi:hypothetical protein
MRNPTVRGGGPMGLFSDADNNRFSLSLPRKQAVWRRISGPTWISVIVRKRQLRVAVRRLRTVAVSAGGAL